MLEFVLILIKQMISVSLNNLLPNLIFYLYKKSIRLSLQLANLSIILPLKLIIFSIIIFILALTELFWQHMVYLLTS